MLPRSQRAFGFLRSKQHGTKNRDLDRAGRHEKCLALWASGGQMPTRIPSTVNEQVCPQPLETSTPDASTAGELLSPFMTGWVHLTLIGGRRRDYHVGSPLPALSSRGPAFRVQHAGRAPYAPRAGLPW